METQLEDKLHDEMLENIVMELEKRNPDKKFEHEYVSAPELSRPGTLSFKIYEIREQRRFGFSRPSQREIAHFDNKPKEYSAFIYDPSASEVIRVYVGKYCEACNKTPRFIRM